MISYFNIGALHSKERAVSKLDLKREFKKGMITQGLDDLTAPDRILELHFHSPDPKTRNILPIIPTDSVNLEPWRKKVMNKFSAESKKKLNECHPFLQLLARKVLEKYDLKILEGHRPEETQNKLFDEGKSKVKFPDGKHNSRPSLAVDMAPYPIDWNDTKRFYHFAGYVQAQADALGIVVRWGGDWDRDNDLNDQHFMDLVHFELLL